MKVAVIGSGGREHAITWKISQSDICEKVYTIPGNGGTPNNVPLDIMDFKSIRDFCEKKGVDLLIVGPEVPLAAGITDYFLGSTVKVFGPDQRGAILESSKIQAKKFMQKYDVASAEFKEFILRTDQDKIESYIKELNGKVVVKYDGLAAGKGVFVCDQSAQALEAIEQIKSIYGLDSEVLIEEKLTGVELSIIGITDGKTIKLLLPSQDHKQLLDQDRGPNTGGMGAYCPVPFCDQTLMEQIKQTIIDPTIKGIDKEGFHYIGVVYFGLMITATGPKVLEYNVRLGDPETEVILPALKSDLLEVMNSSFNGTLSKYELEFHQDYFLDVVLVAGGYPGNYKKGLEISGLQTTDSLIFHAGTRSENGKIYTNGGRVLNVVGRGKTLHEAIVNTYSNLNKIRFKDVYYRRDIGKRNNRV